MIANRFPVGFIFNREMNMDKEKQALEQERNELNSIIQKGFEFSVKDTAFDVSRTWYGRKRYEKRDVIRKFKITEPTLGTLDRLSAEWIEFAIDEHEMQSDDVMERARTLAANHSERCARIVAIAVLGNDRYIAKPVGNGATTYIEDTGKIQELTSLFMRTIKPSDMYKLVVVINTMCNLGDFTNSIRSMLADRTTMPIRIEGEPKV